jgi:hypothetical protein
MATRSTISVQLTKTNGKTIYCHWSGYPSSNGKILKENYNTLKKVKELIKLGDLSILGTTIGEKVPFNGFDSQKNPQCLAYGRDRGETGTKARPWGGVPSEKQAWDYLFKDGNWYVSQYNNEFVLLTDEIIEKDEI